jgi:protein SCO1/2
MKCSSLLRFSAALVPAALLAGLGIAGLLRIERSRRAAALPVVRPVPPFTFTERNGRTVSRDDLLGRVWIADFIFTSCAATCPAMTAQMTRLQDALPTAGREVALVSFTVDPDRDSLEALQAYAGKNGAQENWLFLRGPKEAVTRLSREGFLLGAGPVPGAAEAEAPRPEPGTEPIAHDRHFALVDREGRIRGYYDGVDGERVDALARDARALLSERAR